MSQPAFAFDHLHIISQHPKDSANWYLQMCGAEIVADTVARGAPEIVLERGGKTLIMRGQRPGEAPTAGRAIQQYTDDATTIPGGPITAASSVTVTGAPSLTSCARKGCAFPCPCRKGSGGRWLCAVAAPDGVSIERMQG